MKSITAPFFTVEPPGSVLATVPAGAFDAPLWPATGRLTMPRTYGAVAPAHLPVADWSPTGQRAASTAARATCWSMTCLHFGLPTSIGLPARSRISLIGVGAQYTPSAAMV